MATSALKEKNAKIKRKNQKKIAGQKAKKNKLGLISMIALIIVIAVLSMRIWSNWNKIGKKNREIADLTAKRDHLRIENDALQEKIDAPTDEDYIIDIARDNGYRKPDEIIYIFNGND